MPIETNNPELLNVANASRAKRIQRLHGWCPPNHELRSATVSFDTLGFQHAKANASNPITMTGHYLEMPVTSSKPEGLALWLQMDIPELAANHIHATVQGGESDTPYSNGFHEIFIAAGFAASVYAKTRIPV